MQQGKNKYFLATTALEEFWDTSKPVVFLGEWCKRYGRRSFWEPLNAKTVGMPIRNTAEVISAYSHLKGIYEKLLAALAERLNKIHGTSHSRRYWRIMAGNWLFDYLSAVYDRYLYLKSAENEFPGFETILLSPGSFITPRDTLDFLKLICDDPYNLQLISRLTKKMMPGKNYLEKKYDIKTREFAATAGSTALSGQIRMLAKRWLGKWSAQKARSKSLIFKYSYFSDEAQDKLIRWSNGKIGILTDPLEAAPRMVNDPDLRAGLAGIPIGEDEFTGLVAELLPLDVPQCLVEDYRPLSKEISSWPQPRLILSAVGWYTDDRFKRWAAELSEKGTKLIGVQHGGNYGSDAFHYAEEHELQIADRYFSWGWEKAGASKLTPFYSAKLSERKPFGADNKKDGILFATTGMPRYTYVWRLFPHSQFLDYLENEKAFIAALAPDHQKQLRMRIFANDFGWECAARFKDAYPAVRIESTERAFLESLADCRLFITDHPSTTYLEALSSGKPTILFWDRRVHLVRPEAEEYYEDLRQAGILHDSPQQAAEAVNAVCKDVEKWWGEGERQQAVKRFCRRFARTSPQALEAWAEKLEEMMKGE